MGKGGLRLSDIFGLSGPGGLALGQSAFAHRALMNSLAALGKWTQADEKKAA